MTEPEILYACQDGIGTITLNRPQARNALDLRDVRGHRAHLRDPAGHGGARVLI